MSEIEVYDALNRIVQAAEAGDLESVIIMNNEFSTLLHREYGHLPSWSINEDVLKYDRVRNKAGEVSSGWILRNTGLREMRELFSQIPKPK